MKKYILTLTTIITTILLMPSLSAIDVGRPLLDTSIEYGNTYSYVQGFRPWQTAPNVPESLNGDDVRILGYYLDGYLNYRGTRTTTRDGTTYSYYYWTYTDDVPTALRLTAPQVSEVAFNRRADLNGDGTVSEADKTLLQQFINNEINTFPCCADLITADMDIMERISFIMTQLVVNPIFTLVEIIIYFAVNVLIIIMITQIIFPKFKMDTWKRKKNKTYKKSGVTIVEIKEKIKDNFMKKILVASTLAAFGTFIIQAFFLSSITSGLIGYSVSATLTFMIYAVLANYIFKVEKKHITEFAIMMVIMNIIVWYLVSLM